MGFFGFKKKSEWNKFVDKIRREHPEMSLKQALKEASKKYKKSK